MSREDWKGWNAGCYCLLRTYTAHSSAAVPHKAVGPASPCPNSRVVAALAQLHDNVEQAGAVGAARHRVHVLLQQGRVVLALREGSGRTRRRRKVIVEPEHRSAW